MNPGNTVYVPIVIFMPMADKSTTNFIPSELTDAENSIGSHIGQIGNKLKRQTSTTKITTTTHSKYSSANMSITTETTIVESTSTKKTKKRSYYQTEYISNPCAQLFGPQHPLDYNSFSEKNESDIDTSRNENENPFKILKTESPVTPSDDCYIPAPRWNKTQNLLLEELYKKSRFPKSAEIKYISQRLHVMDSDVEEWFRKRRGRDRKIKRKNDNLKSLIDNYLHQ